MYRQNVSVIFLSAFLILALMGSSLSAGKVYLVIGSDTAIWDGMNTGRYNCTYNQSLFTDPLRNAYTVMDPAFRAELVDSYGQPMKMTWWMMAGNIFRYATNNNFPVPNIMTLYLMKKYHGENVLQNGDELSLHYHTFFWSDYDNDGMYYWNQSRTFMESLSDFNVTLAQFLLEEQTFPVSFRSGWHYMDNGWQNYLDERVLPYSMHNAYPSRRTTDPEPIDNIYDWSQAPSTFVPYHPSTQNYQVPGDGPGWQVRSASFWSTRVNDYMETVFEAATNQGPDQVACFWAHLPEADFPENMQIIDSLAHRYAALYDDVEFQYCTAIEAMQLWRNSSDQQPPMLNFSDERVGDAVYFNIEVDEVIFQQQPFVAVKNIYEKYIVLDCIQTGVNQWKTIESVPLSTLAKAGVSVSDTMGNQSMEFLAYLPDDAFIDNLDAGYNELFGNWSTSTNYSWGINSRITSLAENDSALVSWTYPVPQSAYYNVFIQFPDIPNQAERRILILNNHIAVDTIYAGNGHAAKQWIFISTVNALEGSDITVEMSASGQNQPGTILTADVLKITPLVRERDIELKESIVDFGQFSVGDTSNYLLQISNIGINELQITTIHSINESVTIGHFVPFNVPPMASVFVPLSFISMETGTQTDTLEIYSNDPADPLIKMLVSADVLEYFHTIDNEDSNQYQEFGNWYNSVANIYGPTSRYAPLNTNPLASARFYTHLNKGGTYDIQVIVPSTVNSTDDALYEVKIAGVLQASYHVDQNQGSGNWVTIGNVNLPANTEIELWLKDTGSSTVGVVIRTDAVRFQLVNEITAIDDQQERVIQAFKLEQNFPNPFNPKTTIKYQLPKASHVNLGVYNLLGQKMAVLLSQKQPAGAYTVEFDGSSFASGVYFYRIETNTGFVATKKFILLK